MIIVCVSFLVGVAALTSFDRVILFLGRQTPLAEFHHKRVEIIGTVLESRTTKKITTVSMQVHTVRIPHKKEMITLRGSVRVATNAFPVWRQGDTITALCTLVPATSHEYQSAGFFAAQDIFTLCKEITSVQMISRGRGVSFFSYVHNAKDFFVTTIARYLPEPHASLLSGILFGNQNNFDNEIKQQFVATGVSHILAVSGYNITMIANVLFSLSLALRLRRDRAIICTSFMIFCFAALVGGGASVVRAAFMGLTPYAAALFGRLTNPLYVLMIVATGMVVMNPFILLYDIGFGLSFAATAGILVITPKLLARPHWLFDHALHLKELAAMTISATLATMPLIILHFETISLIFLPMNLFILPVIPFIMASGSVLLIAGMFLPAIASGIAYVPYVLISYVLYVVRGGASLAFATVVIPAYFGLLCVGFFGVACVYRYLKKYRTVAGALHFSFMYNGEKWEIEERITQ